MTAALPLTPAQALAGWRQRYPEALLCTTCGRLLATERARFARLTDAEVAAYTCAECRWEPAEGRSTSVLPRRSKGRNKERVTEPPGGAIGVQAPGFSPPLPPVISGASDTKNRDRAIASGRAFMPGRPKHTPEALRLAARERQRRRRVLAPVTDPPQLGPRTA